MSESYWRPAFGTVLRNRSTNTLVMLIGRAPGRTEELAVYIWLRGPWVPKVMRRPFPTDEWDAVALEMADAGH